MKTLDNPRGNKSAWYVVRDKKIGEIARFKYKSHAITYARTYHGKVISSGQ